MVALAPTAPATCPAQRACWLRAWDRAKAEKLIPFRVSPGIWAVKAYTVTVTGAGWSDLTCSCPAGQHGIICKHAAVTAKAIAIGVSPIRPALGVVPSTAAEVAEKAAMVAEITRELVAFDAAYALPASLAAARAGLR